MSQFILPSRATDANNNPLSGALLYFYLSGTTTPADVFTDDDMATPHANPVVADSGGLFPPIYTDQAISYRAVLKTAGGATIDEFDPYSIADLGAGSLGFDDSATYAAGTVGEQIKSRQTINDLSRYTLGTGQWPYHDLTFDHVEHGGPTTPIVTDAGTLGFFDPFRREAYIAAGHKGGVQTILGVCQVRGASDASSANHNYVSLQGWTSAITNLGGSAPSMAGGKGALFGMSALAVAYTGTTNLLNITGAEYNVQVMTGASVAYKSGIQIAQMPDDAVSGSVYDAAISLANQSGAVGWNVGILLSSLANGVHSVKTSGTLIGVADSGVFTNGVNLNGATFSGNAFASPDFAVNGSGDVTARNFFSNTSGAVIRLGAAGTASSVAIQFKSSGATVDSYDSSITGFGGGGTQGQGGISVDASILQPAQNNYATIGGPSNYWANTYSHLLTLPERTAASVATPAAGTQVLFIDSADNKLKRKDSTGAVTIVA